MAIEDILHTYIVTNFTYTGTLYKDTAEGASGQYLVMLKTADPEEVLTLCDTQGTEGQALIRFVAVMGEGVAADGAMCRAYAQTLKDQVQTIKGPISTGTIYNIWDNRPSGVVLIGDGVNDLNIWTAYFDVLFRWSIL